MITSKKNITSLFIILLGTILFSLGLGSRDFWGTTEARVAQITKEMTDSGDWVIPRLNGQPRFTKPPLYFWTLSLLSKSVNKGNVNELLARIPSAFCAVLTVLFTFLTAKKISDEKTAVMSAITLSTSWLFFWQAREASIDMMFVMFITVAIMFFVYGLYSGESSKKFYYIMAHASIALAVLTKGPVGIIVPWLGIISYLALTKQLRELKKMQWLAGIIIFTFIMSPWIYALFLRNKAAFSVFYHETFNRYTDSFDHTRPFYFYLFSIPYGLLPWGIFLPFAIKDALKNRGNMVYLFCFAFAIPAFIFFSICGSKRSYYVIPLYPYFAMAVSGLLIRLGEMRGNKSVISKFIFNLKNKPNRLTCVILTFVLAFSFIISFLNYSNDKYSAVDLCEKLKTLIPENGLLKTYKYSRPYIVYYMGRQIQSIESEEGLVKEIKSNPNLYVLLQEKDYKKMGAVNANIVYKYPNFTKKKNDMVLINGRKDS